MERLRTMWANRRDEGTAAHSDGVPPIHQPNYPPDHSRVPYLRRERDVRRLSRKLPQNQADRLFGLLVATKRDRTKLPALVTAMDAVRSVAAAGLTAADVPQLQAIFEQVGD